MRHLEALIKKARIHTVLKKTVAALALKSARNRTFGKMKESDHKQNIEMNIFNPIF